MNPRSLQWEFALFCRGYMYKDSNSLWSVVSEEEYRRKMRYVLIAVVSLVLAVSEWAVACGNVRIISETVEVNRDLSSSSDFVTASDGRFFLNEKPYFYAGTNCYYLMVYAAEDNLRGYVDEVLQDAAAMGLTVIRTWAFNDGAAQWNALQTAPGVYQERVFRGLDYVLHKADELDLKLILPFVNNWDDYGGMNQYVAWAGNTGHDEFYTNSDCKTWYKNHISTVLSRVNTYNGRVYKDDPTVFAWELANEPRAASKGVSVLNAWVEEMSDYVKSLDNNHMLAVGIEGFYSTPGKNPVSWMNSQGTDFVTTQQHSAIDFAVAHSWPDTWLIGQSDTMNFLQRQITDAHTVLNKPFILEEFGKRRPLSTRDHWYQLYFDLIYNNRAAGWNFWTLYHDAYPDYDGFGVYYPADASTVAIIESYAAMMRKLIPDLVLSSLGDSRSAAEGTSVYNADFDIVTAAFPGHFYMQEEDRSAGIRVESTEHVQRGDKVRVVGPITSGEFEKYISALYLDRAAIGSTVPGALWMSNRAVGGVPPANWPGPTDTVGAYNVGLLVRVAGSIIPGTNFFYLEDGSGVKVKILGNPPTGSSGKMGVVTGIAGYESGGQRVVRPRDSADIQVF